MDYDKFKEELNEYEKWSSSLKPRQFKDVVFRTPDNVNSPAHYTRGRVEAIEIIEDAVQDAPTPIDGMYQAQVLKYLLRLWVKDNPEEDAAKARWYLNRLIDRLAE